MFRINIWSCTKFNLCAQAIPPRCLFIISYPTHARGVIDQFRYIKIQPKTIDLNTRLWGENPTNSVFIPLSLALRSIVLGWILIYWYWSIARGVKSLIWANGDVLLDRVCFFGLAVLNRVYNLTCLCPKQCQNLSWTGYGITSWETLTRNASMAWWFFV